MTEWRIQGDENRRRMATQTGRAVAMGLALVLAGGMERSSAQPSEQVPVGPRAIALGGAFSAVADDASALFWNPAGLPSIEHQELATSRADLFGLGIVDNHAAFVLPLTRRYVVGLDWYHSGFDDPELRFSEDRFDLALGFQPHGRLALGATVKYLTRNTDLDGVSVRDGGGFGMDLGVLVRPWRNLRLAAVAQDVFDTRVQYSNGESAVILPRNLRFAAAYTFRELVTTSLDLDDRVHLGIEAVPWNPIALRVGFQDDTSGEEDATYSFGTGVKVGILNFDYAFENHPVLGSTNHFGLRFTFNFNPSQIRIEKVELDNLYSSFYKTYTKTPIGTVQVRNLKNLPLAVTLSTFVPDLMQAPTEKDVILRPRTVQDIPLHAVFSERIMQVTDDRPIQFQIDARYASARLVRTDKAAGGTVLFAAGAIDWGAGVEQAAAFVTTRDPIVDAVAREASRSVALQDTHFLGNRNLGLAAALFNALDALGIAYVPDPNNPFTEISETQHAIDTIQYPRQTLRKRSGDCDDTSVLMAALLQNVGVRTQLVDAPGHLMILFATDVHERNQIGLGLPEDLYAVVDSEVWIPLETTALGAGFAASWQQGAAAFKSWEARGQIVLVDVTASQARFAPALPGGVQESPVLDVALVGQRVKDDAAIVSGWRRAYLASRFEGSVRDLTASEAALNEVAHVYYSSGEIGLAERQLRNALQSARSLQTLNNLGVTLAAGGHFDAARIQFEEALRIEASNAALWLNLGLVACAQGELDGLSEIIAAALKHSGGYEASCKLLGLPPRAARPGESDERRLLHDTLVDIVSGVPSSGTDATKASRLENELTKRMLWMQ